MLKFETANTVAKRLPVARSTFFAMLADGRVRPDAVTSEGHYLFGPGWVDEFLAKQQLVDQLRAQTSK